MPAKKKSAAKTDARARIRAHALSLPEAWEDHPWGESVAKVGKKVFAFLGKGEDAGAISMALKLPISGREALTMPFAEPCGYGLWKSGWVAIKIPAGQRVPPDLLRGWIEESYRAVAPKSLLKKLGEGGYSPSGSGKAGASAPSRSKRAKASS